MIKHEYEASLVMIERAQSQKEEVVDDPKQFRRRGKYPAQSYTDVLLHLWIGLAFPVGHLQHMLLTDEQNTVLRYMSMSCLM